MIKFDIALRARPRVVIAFGVFDGVHLGHRRIITETLKSAHHLNAIPLAVTFDPHPRTLFAPAQPVELLVPFEERIKLLHDAGIQGVGIINFTAQFANLKPEEFLNSLQKSAQFDLQGICVGKNWHFGEGGRGDRFFLTDYCRVHQLAFKACPHFTVNHKIVSSSIIRQKLHQGDLAGAARMLGAAARLFGAVETGRQIGSRVLKTPTANLQPYAGIVPPDGVYSALVEVQGRQFPAAVNVGFSPTFAELGHDRRIEAHLLDFSGNLYGQQIVITWLNYLRPERKFASPQELQRQIAADINAIRQDACAAANR